MPTCWYLVSDEAISCTCSKNSNKVSNLGWIHGGLSGHLPKVEGVADTSTLHKRFVAQHKIRAVDCISFLLVI